MVPRGLLGGSSNAKSGSACEGHANARAGLPRGNQDVRGSRAINQMQKQGRGMPKVSIRMSVAGGSRMRGTRDQLGCQPDNKACLLVAAAHHPGRDMS